MALTKTALPYVLFSPHLTFPKDLIWCDTSGTHSRHAAAERYSSLAKQLLIVVEKPPPFFVSKYPRTELFTVLFTSALFLSPFLFRFQLHDAPPPPKNVHLTSYADDFHPFAPTLRQLRAHYMIKCTDFFLIFSPPVSICVLLRISYPAFVIKQRFQQNSYCLFKNEPLPP